jgi:hypothetical protein
LDRTRA